MNEPMTTAMALRWLRNGYDGMGGEGPEYEAIADHFEKLVQAHRDMAIAQAKAEARLLTEIAALHWRVRELELEAELESVLEHGTWAERDPAENALAAHRNVPPAPIPEPSNWAQDAARYRYLRASPHFNSDMGRLRWYLPMMWREKQTLAERLDESVDEAMKEPR